MNSPIKYHGGKRYLLPYLRKIQPPALHRVETHCGAAWWTLDNDPKGSEVINDLDGRVTNFWKTLRDQYEAFKHLVDTTPFSEQEFDEARDTTAVGFFIRCRMSLAGRMKDFTVLSKTRLRGNMNEQVSAWLTAIDGLSEVHMRLRRIVIFNKDAVKVIEQQDSESTLFYCDPPYMRDTRTSPDVYRYEMSAEKHRELLETLSKIKGRFMLSGYENTLYNDYCRIFKWNRYDVDVPNNAAGGDIKRRMIESIWTN